MFKTSTPYFTCLTTTVHYLHLSKQKLKKLLNTHHLFILHYTTELPPQKLCIMPRSITKQHSITPNNMVLALLLLQKFAPAMLLLTVEN
jgi:hypothetical protein